MSDKRQFTRVPLDVEGQLAHNNIAINVTICDVSLQGVRLIANEDDLSILPFDSHEPYSAMFRANEDSPLITLHIEQLYRQNDSRKDTVSLGCKVASMDVDSISALRRLIVLNCQNADLEEKELNALIDAVYSNASSASDS